MSRAPKPLDVGGKKFDGDKPMMNLLSNIALRAIATVLTFGSKKYGSHNWREGIAWSRLLAATLRHRLAFQDGEDLDEESGLPHIDLAACELMFLQELYRTRKELDDRYKIEVAA